MSAPCLRCKGENTGPHCENPDCDWIRCLDKSCNQVTWIRKAEA